jgi:hypothetical protein
MPLTEFVYCVTVTFIYLLPLSSDFSFGKSQKLQEPNVGCRGADRPGWCDALPEKSLYKSCRMGRLIVVMKLICSLGHCECDGHTEHKLSQRYLTADWLAPQETDCSWMHSKVSSDWLPSYIQATPPVLIFKMSGYFLDSPHMVTTQLCNFINCDGCRSRQKTCPLLCVLCMAL